MFKVSAHILSVATKGHANLGSEGIPLKAYKTIKVKPFDCTSTTAKEFDPLVHLEIEEHKGEDENQDLDNADEYAVGDEEKMCERIKVD